MSSLQSLLASWLHLSNKIAFRFEVENQFSCYSMDKAGKHLIPLFAEFV